MKKRIWELDAFRGLCVLGMVAVHFVYDLVELFGVVNWQYPAAFSLVKNWGGVLFLLLSGVCVTLGSRSVRRGGIVFACGMLCTAVTWGMYHFGFADRGIIIYFGVLHCLGVCMLLWPCFRRCSPVTLAVLGLFFTVSGLYLRTVRVDFSFLIPLGCVPGSFSSSDFFPLLPNLGFFLLGAVLGKTLYRRQESLLPNVRADRGLFPFLCFCGRQSLFLYLLHQPVLAALVWALTFIL